MAIDQIVVILASDLANTTLIKGHGVVSREVEAAYAVAIGEIPSTIPQSSKKDALHQQN